MLEILNTHARIPLGMRLAGVLQAPESRGGHKRMSSESERDRVSLALLRRPLCEVPGYATTSCAGSFIQPVSQPLWRKGPWRYNVYYIRDVTQTFVVTTRAADAWGLGDAASLMLGMGST
jgi:hypothetical protein